MKRHSIVAVLVLLCCRGFAGPDPQPPAFGPQAPFAEAHSFGAYTRFGQSLDLLARSRGDPVTVAGADAGWDQEYWEGSAHAENGKLQADCGSDWYGAYQYGPITSDATWDAWYRVAPNGSAPIGTQVTLSFDLNITGRLNTGAEGDPRFGSSDAGAIASASFNLWSFRAGSVLQGVTYAGSVTRSQDSYYDPDWWAEGAWADRFDGTALRSQDSLLISAVVGDYIYLGSSIETTEDVGGDWGNGTARSALDATLVLAGARDESGNPLDLRLQLVPEPVQAIPFAALSLLGWVAIRRRLISNQTP
jgi:hypothetical protein